jgi:hypothetical protein
VWVEKQSRSSPEAFGSSANVGTPLEPQTCLTRVHPITANPLFTPGALGINPVSVFLKQSLARQCNMAATICSLYVRHSTHKNAWFRNCFDSRKVIPPQTIM